MNLLITVRALEWWIIEDGAFSCFNEAHISYRGSVIGHFHYVCMIGHRAFWM